MADSYTELEKAVVVLVENFYKYVSKHSLVKNKISKSSFRKMLQKELNHMLTVSSPHPRAWLLPKPLKPLSSQGILPQCSCCTFRVIPPNRGLNLTQSSVLSGYLGLSQ